MIDHEKMIAEAMDESTGYIFCHYNSKGIPCWGEYLRYVERGFLTPYEQTLKEDK